MDLGFGALLDKTKEHFGKKAVRVLLLCIFLAVVVATIRIVIIQGIIPIYNYFNSANPETILSIKSLLARFSWSLIVGLFGFYVAAKYFCMCSTHQ